MNTPPANHRAAGGPAPSAAADSGRRQGLALPALLASVLVAIALAGCTFLGGPSPVMPLPTLNPATATVRPTRVAITPPPGPTLPPTPTLIPLSAQQRQTVFTNTWNLVQTRWVYTGFRGLDWPAIGAEYQPKIAAAASEDEVYRLLAEMIDKLGDQHSAFLNPQEVAEDDALQRGDLQLSGIGVLSQEIAGAVRIVYVVPGGPAQQAGLQPFDIIRAADGTPLTSNADAPHLIRGPAGTPVVLTVETPGHPPRDVTVIRATVTFAFHATARRLSGTNIVYLDLPTFDVDGISAEVRTEITDLAASGPIDGLIIDVRQNGGGLLSELANTLGLFIDGGVAGYEVSRDGRTTDRIPGGRTLAALRNKPVVVLVSNLSESAAERFPAAMQYYHRATIVGTTTAGNTETVYPYDLPYGSRLMLAEDLYLLPDGKTSIEDKGVMPDIVVDVAWYEHTTEDDPQVLAAIQRIQGK